LKKNKIKLQLPVFSVIAARVGSVREVVSRAFSKLEGKKLISVDKKHVATLLSEKGLKNLAGD
jgi:DNA-binding transcriptional regulator YhcF (GntR family)